MHMSSHRGTGSRKVLYKERPLLRVPLSSSVDHPKYSRMLPAVSALLQENIEMSATNYTHKDLDQAVTAVRGGLSFGRASKQFGVPKTTLVDHVNGKPGRKLDLSPDHEAAIVVSPGLSPADQVDSRDLCAAVSGFVVASDRDSLLSAAREVKKRYQCSVCDMGFAIARVCETHEILEHQVPAHWKCGECGMQFIHGAMLSLHMMRSHHLRTHLCAYTGCWAIFYSKTQLTFHKQQHEQQQGQQQHEQQQEQCSELQQLPSVGEKFLYHCPFCPKAYPHQSKLNYHMRMHTGETPYQCTHCPRAFKRSSERTKHVRDFHQRVRNHLCDWCGKKFISTDALRRHTRCHTGEKPYACLHCPRSFSKSNTRLVHMRQHTGEKPYVCDQCGQSFTVRVSLRTHLKSKHDIIVDTSMYRRKEEPGVDLNCLPPIGRPRKRDIIQAT